MPLKPSHTRRRRRAFTLMETLLASSVTALTAVAGSTLIFAVTNASLNTKDLRVAKNKGRLPLNRITTKIRESRGIGDVTPAAIALWESDKNTNDVLELHEICIIRYDANARTISHDYLDTPGGVVPDIAVLESSFTDVAALDTLMAIPDRRTVVWAEEIDNFSFDGYPRNGANNGFGGKRPGTDTRVVEISFTVESNNETLAFTQAVSPRASADYLFVSTATKNPATLGGRQRRGAYSRWTGFTDIAP
ncbi:MAG: type II secretion system protein J [Phycisphaerae bacterium]